MQIYMYGEIENRKIGWGWESIEMRKQNKTQQVDNSRQQPHQTTTTTKPKHNEEEKKVE